jgi:hypothetical protein
MFKRWNNRNKFSLKRKPINPISISDKPIYSTIVKTSEEREPTTIVFAWTQKLENFAMTKSSGFFGLGDILRGILFIYQKCKENRYEFIIDTHRHPFSNFLVNETCFYHKSTECLNVLFFGDDGGKTFNKSLLRQNCVNHILSNSFPTLPLLEDEKYIIRSLLTIKPEFKITLPTHPYSLLHIRIGDSKIDSPLSSTDLEMYFELISKYLVDGDVLCSDNMQFKKFVKMNRPDIIVNLNERRIGHIGYDTDQELLLSTLEDIQFVLGAKKIYTYSNYTWISGFVFWISNCFDIPLEDLRK